MASALTEKWHFQTQISLKNIFYAAVFQKICILKVQEGIQDLSLFKDVDNVLSVNYIFNPFIPSAQYPGQIHFWFS